MNICIASFITDVKVWILFCEIFRHFGIPFMNEDCISRGFVMLRAKLYERQCSTRHPALPYKR